MDTGSESQHTPSSLSDEDPETTDPVLRLQNPETKPILRFNPLKNLENERLSGDLENSVKNIKNEKLNPETDLLENSVNIESDNLINNINSLKISIEKSNRPKNLNLSPKFSSTLTSTTDHPLMGLASPDENYPDLIPKRKEDDKDLSLSSIEDEKHETNGFYSPERNTSKNNLYFNDNFTTAESHILNSLDVTSPPDVAKIEKKFQRNVEKGENGVSKGESGVKKGESGANRLEVLRVTGQSTPKSNEEIQEAEEFHSGVAEWCESPAHRPRPNFDLPIELKTTIKPPNDLDSPDVVSSSQEDRSAYQALLDPYTGSVALRPTPQAKGPTHRRRIQLPPDDDDQCSLDSGSIHSLESEEEPPEPGYHTPVEQEHSKRSTNTLSSCSASEPIPEYSAAEELRDERSWLSVPRPGGPATCDMKVIEPYKRVVSHGGYDASGCALIVFSACHLPDVRRADYHYVMDNLFLYVIWTLERLVPDNYILVYLYGSAGPRRLPTIHWLREYYKLIDRRLRKSLKHLYLVHPTYGLKIFVAFTKAFVSSKFFRKLSYVRNLTELMTLVPVEPNAIPELVKQYDEGKR
ncbi:protein prune homolog 2 [Leguminivora glycinivorella]|uniref:protein prune homolog 2 n=1 Tax=Leguminivora glycinivorella TaxID=1035111 RepID=UPI002010788A|nr:protein prune homolog 2 [Leguminivora glycinivorella]